MKHKIKVGLTGGIGTGKSTISNYARDKGIKVVDADLIAREVLYKYPEILKFLEDKYGKHILEGNELNRKKLAEIIFNDSKEKEEYENVIMPFINEEIEGEVRKFELGNSDILILDAPLLFEKSLDKNMDYNILVYLDKETQIERIIKRNNLSRDSIEKRISSQMNIDEKKVKSDFIIDNRGDIEESKNQFDQIIENILNRKKV